jgi:hypothetical protein
MAQPNVLFVTRHISFALLLFFFSSWRHLIFILFLKKSVQTYILIYV